MKSIHVDVYVKTQMFQGLGIERNIQCGNVPRMQSCLQNAKVTVETSAMAQKFTLSLHPIIVRKCHTKKGFKN